MPFNSAQNSYNASISPEESFRVLQNTYAIPKDGQPYLPYAQLVQRPKTNEPFISPTNIHSSFVYYNQDELKYINNDQRKRQEMTGEGVGRLPYQNYVNPGRHELKGGNFFKKVRRAVDKTEKATKKIEKGANKAVKKVDRTINKAEKGANQASSAVKKGSIQLGDAIKESTINEDGLIHQGIVKFNDYAIPKAGELLGSMAGTAVGTAVGNPLLGEAVGAKVGQLAGQQGRNVLKEKTGYGVGKYHKNINLDKVIDKYVPDYKTGVHKPTVLPRKMSKEVSERNAIVRQVMQEKGLSLPQASKYVKENNLWKK